MNLIKKIQNKVKIYQDQQLVAKTIPKIQEYEQIEGFLFPVEAAGLYYLASLFTEK